VQQPRLLATRSHDRESLHPNAIRARLDRVAGHQSQPADAMYNRYWGCLNTVKIPDHCTAYAVDGGCCCNITASEFFGICRWADFNGPEAGWPQCPL
jgi:hypothetical protein